jgi:hypothetical protein
MRRQTLTTAPTFPPIPKRELKRLHHLIHVAWERHLLVRQLPGPGLRFALFDGSGRRILAGSLRELTQFVEDDPAR